MPTIAPIYIEDLTKFDRNYYILSLNRIDPSLFKDGDIHYANHFPVENYTFMYPEASFETVAGVLATVVQLKMEQGQERFLLAYDDKNIAESLDMLNGLVKFFGLSVELPEYIRIQGILRSYEGKWTKHLLLEKESLSSPAQ